MFGSKYTFRSSVEVSLVWGARFLPLARAVFGSSSLVSTVSVLLGATNFLQSTSFGSGLSLVLPTVWNFGTIGNFRHSISASLSPLALIFAVSSKSAEERFQICRVYTAGAFCLLFVFFLLG